MKVFALAFFLLVITSIVVAADRERSFYFFSNPQSFSTQGIWNPSEPDHPTSHEVQLDCFKKSQLCVEAQADIYEGHPHVSVNYPDILRWDRDGIILRDASTICVTRIIMINFSSRTVSLEQHMKKLPADTRQACETLSIPKDIRFKLAIKGSKEWERIHFSSNSGTD